MYIHIQHLLSYHFFLHVVCLRLIGNTIRFENGNYRTNESVGDFTGVRLVADQPFAEDTNVSISFQDINATGQCSINMNTCTMSLEATP